MLSGFEGQATVLGWKSKPSHLMYCISTSPVHRAENKCGSNPTMSTSCYRTGSGSVAWCTYVNNNTNWLHSSAAHLEKLMHLSVQLHYQQCSSRCSLRYLCLVLLCWIINWALSFPHRKTVIANHDSQLLSFCNFHRLYLGMNCC